MLRFTLAALKLRGVSHVSLVGSLATPKVTPKDADVLVSVASDCELERLAKAGRALKGSRKLETAVPTSSWPARADGTSGAPADGESVGRVSVSLVEQCTAVRCSSSTITCRW